MLAMPQGDTYEPGGRIYRAASAAHAHGWGLSRERRGFPDVDPTTLSGLIFDLNPAVGASLTPASGGLVDGTAIQTAVDQSATAMSLTQGTSSKRPAYAASAGAGHPALLFVRANAQSLANATTSLWTGDPAFTIMAVLSVTDLSQVTFFSTGGSTARTGIGAMANRSGIDGRCDLSSNGAFQGLTGATTGINNPFIITFQKAASSNITTAVAFKNGATTTLSVQTAGVLNLSNTKTIIGEYVASLGSTFAMAGYVFRIVIWNRVLTLTERIGVESRFMRTLLH